MTEYGSVISEYSLEYDTTPHDTLYSSFDDYFNHPIMTKIKDVHDSSMYMCKTYCLLNKDCRYIIVFVQPDIYEKGTQIPMMHMKWKVLQTRTLSDNHKLPMHSYSPKKTGPLAAQITRIDVSPKHSQYSCDTLPIKVVLLHTKDDIHEYQPKGSVNSAIETFSTMIHIQ